MSTKKTRITRIALWFLICACIFTGVMFPALPARGASADNPYQTAEHPGFIRQGYLIAHAMGILDGAYTYTSSLEAFYQNYAAGHRIFEVDFQLTSDGRLVTLHNRATPILTFKEESDAVPYTLMSFEDVCYLMLEYNDIYIVTDTKYIDDAQNKETFDIIESAIRTIIPDQGHRIAIQFYNQRMYAFLKQNYSFPHDNYMYTLYASPDTNRQVMDFVKREAISAVVMWGDRALTDGFALSLKNEGFYVYAHTINNKPAIDNLFDNGVYGIYTDIITYDQMDYTRLGRYAILSQDLSLWADAQVTESILLGLVPADLQARYKLPTTRAEFCALAVSLFETATGAEITGREAFSDTADINVAKMASLGVVNGVGSGRFSPGSPLTREQAATILSRLAAALDYRIPAEDPVFIDNGSLSVWAYEAVGQMQWSGIMGGIGDNTFSPKSPFTREQSIATMLRMFKQVYGVG